MAAMALRLVLRLTGALTGEPSAPEPSVTRISEDDVSRLSEDDVTRITEGD